MFQQPPQGDQVKVAELTGSLVLIWAKEYRKDVPTSFGPSDAIAADVHVLDGLKGGETFENTLLFQRALIGSLQAAIGGDPVLGRIGQGVAKPGQSAPYILQPFTDADAALATHYIQQLGKPFQAPAGQPASTNPPVAAAGTSPAAATPSPAASSAPASPATVDISTLPKEVQELLKQTGAVPA
jgi:hypothetical protein